MHPACRFLTEMFAPGEIAKGEIYLSVLKNDRGGEVARLIISNLDQVPSFLDSHDRPGHGVYFCVSSLRSGATTRSKETLSEILVLHLDLDFKHIVEDQEQVLDVLADLPLPPTKIVVSGHGCHAYWLLAEPLPATTENIIKIEQLTRILRRLLAGDRAPCHPAALMRLPGSHNSKNGEWFAVEVIANRDAFYSFDELFKWLCNCGPPRLAEKARENEKGNGAGNGHDQENAFLAFAAAAPGPPIDVDARLAGMTHQGAGDAGIHLTQLECTASLLSSGVPLDQVIQRVFDATRAAVSQPWNWGREWHKLGRMCRDWIRKHPEIPQPPQILPPQPKPATPADHRPLRSLIINIAPWDNEEPPDQEWGVYNRYPARQTGILSGEGAIGKSSTLLHLCASFTIRHKDWLGALLDHGPALFIDCEDELQVLWRRLVPIARFHGVRFADYIKGGLHLVSLVEHDPVLAFASRSGKIEVTPRYNELLEMAGDLKPKCIAIASSANVYAGSEIDRAQVQQFTGRLTKIARIAGGVLLLAQHPSLTGISSDSGLSGSTQWHNAVRARGYMKAPKTEPDEQPNSDLREIIFKKNQYGKADDTVALQWQNGLFLPIPGRSFSKTVQESQADELFLDLVERFTRENRNVSVNPGRSYAPALFAAEEEPKRAGITSKQLADAMRRLFKDGKIWNEPCGRPSRPAHRIARRV